MQTYNDTMYYNWVFLCAFQAVANKDATTVQVQQQQQQQQQQILSSQPPTREEAAIASRDASGRGDAEDQSQSFLRKKEEELRQKREQERQLAEARSKQAVDTTYTLSAPAAVKAAAAPGVVTKLEFVAVTTATTPPPATVSSSLISAPVVRTAATTTSTTSAAAAKSAPAVAAASAPPPATAASARPLPGASANIPPFYFPLGAPTPLGTVDLDETAARAREEFEKLDDGKAAKNVFGPVMKVCRKCTRQRKQTTPFSPPSPK